MNGKPGPSKDPDILASFKALRRAARKVHQEGLRTGTPVWVMVNGKILDLTRTATAGGRRRASRG